jgi:hypothetical protein
MSGFLCLHSQTGTMSRHQNQNTIQEMLQNCSDCLMRAELIAQPVSSPHFSSLTLAHAGFWGVHALIAAPVWLGLSNHECLAMVLSEQSRQRYHLNLFSVASNNATDWGNYKEERFVLAYGPCPI